MFAVPINAVIAPEDLTSFRGLLAAAKQGLNPVGLYHIANALVFIGICIMIKARRYAVVAVLLAGVIPAFCPAFLQVSPIIWFAIPALGLAILAGEGFSGLVLAGFTDRRWVLSAGFLSVVFSIAAFIFAAGFQSINIPEDFQPQKGLAPVNV
jgi:hypothetical protein